MSISVHLVRHGETTGNRSGQRCHNPVLTPLGWEQARRLAERLVGSACTRVIASPLVRALETASCLADRIAAPIEIWNDLAEYNRWGRYRGASRRGLAGRFPRARLEAAMPASGWTYPAAETPQMAQARARRAATRLAGLPDGTVVAVVAHGNLNGFLLRHWLGATAAALIAQDNACVNRVQLLAAGAVIVAINDIAHLV